MSLEQVIILCQGQQTRLPDLPHPKHLLRLLRCNRTILGRTVELVRKMEPQAGINVVAGPEIREYIGMNRHLYSHDSVWVYTLARPGNSVLTGLSDFSKSFYTGGNVAVLLGDVVWSRAALRAVLRDERPMVFAGTTDISGSGGEIFGLRWNWDRKTESPLYESPLGLLRVALEDNPKVDTYQAGQLRRMLWAYQRARGIETEQKLASYWGEYYLPVTDWTKDIDTPADLARLDELDAKAVQEEADELVAAAGGQWVVDEGE